LTVNDFDGLGCASRYQTQFLPVQAEFDCLPIPDRSVDLVVFNASLHYSTNYAATLGESLRVLLPGGRIIVLDSPIYHDAESGRRMVAEREAQFSSQYGFPSNSLASEGYLTWTRIEQLAYEHGLDYRAITPFYGLRWNARPIIARLFRRREPAGFHVIVFS
jgi:SAM-dependent methyltransferase